MKKLRDELKEHYLEYSTYTYPGFYGDVLKTMPDDIQEIGLLVRKSFIHRTTLEAGNTYNNTDLRFGDMTKVPWWRQPEDDVLQTAPAMLAELYRRDSKGLSLNREPQDKLVLTCRYVSILMASILKTKGIPCRVRAGHVPYFDMGKLGDVSTDHWFNQYWSDEEGRWVTIDVDGSLSLEKDIFDPYDVPEGKIDYAADAWLNVRSSKVDAKHFYNAGGFRGLRVILWSLAYDFHSIMNDEIIYNHGFTFSELKGFKALTEKDLKEIDNLAGLMQDIDRNFNELTNIWNNNKKFRLLAGSLL